MSANQRSTVPKGKPARRVATPRPPSVKRGAPPPRLQHAHPLHNVPQPRPPNRRVAHIIDDSEKSLVDVLDSLLNQGVVLNAEVILALANVDLVYLRLSALLCAADRVLPREP
jgi:hypothetical protein